MADDPHHGGYHNDYHPAYYNYAYKVNDDYHKVDFGHQENRDGKKTEGSYHVLLPDGRVQTVKYYVDGYSGYVADVSYSGHGYHAEPSYHHAPPPPPQPHYGYGHH